MICILNKPLLGGLVSAWAFDGPGLPLPWDNDPLPWDNEVAMYQQRQVTHAVGLCTELQASTRHDAGVLALYGGWGVAAPSQQHVLETVCTICAGEIRT